MVEDKKRSLVEDIMACYEETYNMYSSIVDNIINNNIKDEELIKDTLDHIIYIYTEKGFDLYMKLLFYFGSFNLHETYKYIDKIKKQRDSDYKAYVKKLEKQK